MNEIRRMVLRMAGGAGTLTVAAAAGLVTSGNAWSAWNKEAFESKALPDALKAIGAGSAAESKDIVMTAPDIAENGAVVPVAITSKIPNTESISIVAAKNPFPLVASFGIANGAESYVSTRIKMGQTSDVWAVVKADGKYFTTKKEIKVTVGGCG